MGFITKYKDSNVGVGKNSMIFVYPKKRRNQGLLFFILFAVFFCVLFIVIQRGVEIFSGVLLALIGVLLWIGCLITNSLYESVKYHKKDIHLFIRFLLQSEFIKIDRDVKSLSEKGFLTKEREVRIFKNNMRALKVFEFLDDYKYTAIAMGAILEFLLSMYFEINFINVPRFRGKEPNFYQYIQTAIKEKVFDREVMRWKIIQDCLREFRNYIHIGVEITSDDLDEPWINTLTDAFYILYNKFISQSKNDN